MGTYFILGGLTKFEKDEVGNVWGEGSSKNMGVRTTQPTMLEYHLKCSSMRLKNDACNVFITFL